jgi:UPF0716 protein FxsA
MYENRCKGNPYVAYYVGILLQGGTLSPQGKIRMKVTEKLNYNENMFFKLFLLFTVIPVAELAILIKVGSVIGTFNTIAIVIMTAVVGAYMVKMEGLGIIYRIQQNMEEGIFPAEELISGVMILVAGALLLTPGFLTDVIGFLLVVPASRNIIKRVIKQYLKKRMDVEGFEDTTFRQ